MKTGKRDKFNNSGFTLIELIVVIAIMAALVGMSSIGIGLAFSQDANRCATTLNDALTEARMYTMSKQGEYSLVISKDSSDMYVAKILREPPGGGTSSVEAEYDLEGESKKIESITVSGTLISSSDEVIIVFDRTKGNVHSVSIGGTPLTEDTVLEFNIVPKRGGDRRTAMVSLVTGTGKHQVGKFN